MTGLTRRAAVRLGAASGLALGGCAFPGLDAAPDLVLTGGRITTLDPERPEATAVAIADGRFAAVGGDAEIMALRGGATRVIDLGGRRAIPGLIDSHIHVIRGGLNYNMELRWEGVPSLAEAMALLRTQAAVTPPPQWVRVVGGFTRHQFKERRLPTLAELNEAAPETPVFILHLYDRALLNRAALRAVGYTKETPDPPGGRIERDGRGNPTGLLVAEPNATILYATLAKGPRLPRDVQKTSTRHFMRELNRLGVTSVVDAGGGYQNYPDDYRIIEELHREDLLTLRIAYNLFTQKPKEELADFASWARLVRPGQGDDLYRHNGAGEMLVYSAADFEDFRVARPEMPATMEGDLEPVVRLLAQNGWPFRLHATYDETISRALDVFERVDRAVPLRGLHWFIDHAETVSPRNIDRIAAMGGGIAIQHRMAFQGEDFVARYGAAAAAETPPIARMLAAGLPVGAGTDATRVASYNPWVSLAWLVTGRTVGGLVLYSGANRLDRVTALRLWTERNSWFSTEEGKKGRVAPGELADLAVLSADYLAVPDEEIAELHSVLTLLGGQVVHGEAGYRELAPPLPPAAPDWTPVGRHDAYRYAAAAACSQACRAHSHATAAHRHGFWGASGCACWVA